MSTPGILPTRHTEKQRDRNSVMLARRIQGYAIHHQIYAVGCPLAHSPSLRRKVFGDSALSNPPSSCRRGVFRFKFKHSKRHSKILGGREPIFPSRLGHLGDPCLQRWRVRPGHGIALLAILKEEERRDGANIELKGQVGHVVGVEAGKSELVPLGVRLEQRLGLLGEDGGDGLAGAAPGGVGLEGDVGVLLDEGVEVGLGLDVNDRHGAFFYISLPLWLCLWKSQCTTSMVLAFRCSCTRMKSDGSGGAGFSYLYGVARNVVASSSR